jgi:tetratricopeptide (TPR) repeat protein
MRKLIAGLAGTLMLLAVTPAQADEAAYRRAMATAEDSVKREDHAAAALVLETAVNNAQVFGANDMRLAAALQKLGHARRMLHDYKPAEASYLRALGILERSGGGETLQRSAEVVHGLGEISQLQGRFDDAENYYEQELALLQ